MTKIIRLNKIDGINIIRKDILTLDLEADVKKGDNKNRSVEENVKIKMILPFLNALGWNTAKDIDAETHDIKNKRIDFTISKNNYDILFIVEIKDLDINLDDCEKQAQEYANDKGVWFYLLTNGKEYRIYQTCVEKDSPDNNLILKSSWKDLIKDWNKIYSYLSYEKIQNKIDELNSDKNLSYVKRNVNIDNLLNLLKILKDEIYKDFLKQFKQKYELDKDFKTEIDDWIKKINFNIIDEKKWKKTLCLEGTYSLVNRILFIRFYEDCQNKKEIISGDTLIDYENSGNSLREFVKTAFNKIKTKYNFLYSDALFDDLKYDDLKFNDSILKDALDKLNRISFKGINKDILGDVYQKHISSSERKKLGEFYTPQEIIDYIISNVPINSSMKILDPACGSGGFLITVFNHLKKELIGKGIKEETAIKMIFKNNIYGVDIMAFASQLTIMNLLLKCLDFPPKDMNIYTEDSLKDISHYLNNEKIYDLFNSKYDLIIENPPYIHQKGKKGHPKIPTEYRNELKHTFKTIISEEHKLIGGTKINLFVPFIERSINMLKEKGYFACVVHKNILSVGSYALIRKYILDNCKIHQIVDLGGKHIFDDVVGETVILILQKEMNKTEREKNKIKIITGLKSKESLMIKNTINYIEQKEFYNENNNYMFSIYINGENKEILNMIEKDKLHLGNITKIISYGCNINKEHTYTSKKSDKNKLAVKGKDIGRYEIKQFKYIDYENPYISRKGDINAFESEKIIMQRISNIKATYDNKGVYCFNSINMLLELNKNYPLKYILGILNSELMNYYIKFKFFNNSKFTQNATQTYINELPISDANEKEKNKMIELVDKIINLKKKKNDDDEIKQINLEIENLVYKLYFGKNWNIYKDKIEMLNNI